MASPQRSSSEDFSGREQVVPVRLPNAGKAGPWPCWVLGAM